MRKAASLINEQVKTYSSSYAIKDPRDLLAMCALQFALQQVEHVTVKENSDKAEQKLKAIEGLLHIVK